MRFIIIQHSIKPVSKQDEVGPIWDGYAVQANVQQVVVPNVRTIPGVGG